MSGASGTASSAWSAVGDFATTSVGMYFGDKESWDRGSSATNSFSDKVFNSSFSGVIDSTLNGVHDFSSVGVLDAMRLGNYELAGSRGTGALVGLAGGAVAGSLGRMASAGEIYGAPIGSNRLLGVAYEGVLGADKIGLDTSGDFITFYHGGSPESISSIRVSGIDLSRSKPLNDFGDGFYMTTSRADAIVSAKMVNSEQALVKFRVPKSELENLNSLKFDSPNQEWANFVSQNKHLDVPYLPPAEWASPTFDLVEGPLFRGFSRNGEIRNWTERANQTSIHTDRAVDLFNKYMVR